MSLCTYLFPIMSPYYLVTLLNYYPCAASKGGFLSLYPLTEGKFTCAYVCLVINFLWQFKAYVE